MKVLLLPNWDIAKKVKKSGLKIHVTIECEYGKNVLEGSDFTLAHHVESYKHHDAPCLVQNKRLRDDQVVGISHMDWDVVGAMVKLLGIDQADESFWRAVADIDLMGPHHLHKYPTETQERMNAYWSWTSRNGKLPSTVNVNEPIDVTDIMMNHVETVSRILKGDHLLIESGRQWIRSLDRRVLKCLVKETRDVRIFVTNDVKCTSHYFSETYKSVVPLIAEYNTNSRKIRLSCFNKSFDVVRFMSDFFGDEAGGKEGIACSPREYEVSWEQWIQFLSVLDAKCKQVA